MIYIRPVIREHPLTCGWIGLMLLAVLVMVIAGVPWTLH